MRATYGKRNLIYTWFKNFFPIRKRHNKLKDFRIHAEQNAEIPQNNYDKHYIVNKEFLKASK